MKTTEFMTLLRESGEISDKFYRCISLWLRATADRPSRSDCIEVGKVYADALTRQLQFLRALSPDVSRDEAIRRCEGHLHCLERSVGILESGIRRDH